MKKKQTSATANKDYGPYHKRMCKKIAQLTKVVQRLNTVNLSHALDIQQREELHREEVSYLAKDAEDKVATTMEQMRRLEKDFQKSLHMQKKKDDHARVSMFNQHNADRRQERDKYESRLKDANQRLEKMQAELAERNIDRMERERLALELKGRNAVIEENRREYCDKEAALQMQIGQMESEWRGRLEQVQIDFDKEKRGIYILHEEHQSEIHKVNVDKIQSIRAEMDEIRQLETETIQKKIHHEKSMRIKMEKSSKDLLSRLEIKENELQQACVTIEENRGRHCQLKDKLQQQINENEDLKNKLVATKDSSILLERVKNQLQSQLNSNVADFQLKLHQLRTELIAMKEESSILIRRSENELRSQLDSTVGNYKCKLNELQFQINHLKKVAHTKTQIMYESTVKWKHVIAGMKTSLDNIKQDYEAGMSQMQILIMYVKATLTKRIATGERKIYDGVEKYAHERQETFHRKCEENFARKEKQLREDMQIALDDKERDVLERLHAIEHGVKESQYQEKVLLMEEKDRINHEVRREREANEEQIVKFKAEILSKNSIIVELKHDHAKSSEFFQRELKLASLQIAKEEAANRTQRDVKYQKLRSEIEGLKKQIDDISESHNDKVSKLKDDLAESHRFENQKECIINDMDNRFQQLRQDNATTNKRFQEMQLKLFAAEKHIETLIKVNCDKNTLLDNQRLRFDQICEESRARHSQVLDEHAMEYKKELERWSLEKMSLESTKDKLELQKKRMAKRHVLNILLWQRKHLDTVKQIEVAWKEKENKQVVLLETALSTSKTREDKVQKEIAFYKRELQNREENFNRRFRGSSNGGGLLSTSRPLTSMSISRPLTSIGNRQRIKAPHQIMRRTKTGQRIKR